MSTIISSVMNLLGLGTNDLIQMREKMIKDLQQTQKIQKMDIQKLFNKLNEPTTTIEPNPFKTKEKSMSSYKSSLLPKYIYHMTHIDNLKSILDHGLYSHGNPYQSVDISNNAVNDRRNRKESIYGKPIHSYVPFYFNPKNPMLYVRKHIQRDIVILACENSLILKPGSLISDGNAASSYTRFGKGNLSSLAKLDWHIINKSKDYASDYRKKRVRMAETLVPDHVCASSIKKIICHNYFTANRVENFTNKSVVVDKKFYF